MKTEDQDIVANAAEAAHFSTLTNALKAAGLVKNYQAVGPFTMFAPTDAAFEKLPEGTLNALLKDRAKLAAILNSHVIKGHFHERDLEARDTRNLQGLTLKIAANDEGFTVNGAKVGKAEILASNGIIHAIDAVLLPV